MKELLEAGGVIVYPTCTCYGLGCDATNEQAVRKVYEIKKRPLNKPLTVIFSDIKMWKEYAFINKDFVKRISGKPVTVLFKKKKTIPNIVTGNKIGGRIAVHPIALGLVKDFGKPIIATSANVSGQLSCYSIQCVKKQLRADAYIDAGVLPKNPPTTIIDYETKKVIRQGAFNVWK